MYLLPLDSINELREGVQKDYQSQKQKEFEAGPKASEGYGGKFGVMGDRMDKVCLPSSLLSAHGSCSSSSECRGS